MKGRIVAIYESQKKAALKTGIPMTNINRAINGHRQTAGGYMWERIDPQSKKKKHSEDEEEKETVEYLKTINRNEIPAKRVCLSCNESFSSQSNRNRICPKCTIQLNDIYFLRYRHMGIKA